MAWYNVHDKLFPETWMWLATVSRMDRRKPETKRWLLPVLSGALGAVVSPFIGMVLGVFVLPGRVEHITEVLARIEASQQANMAHIESLAQEITKHREKDKDELSMLNAKVYYNTGIIDLDRTRIAELRAELIALNKQCADMMMQDRKK
jgi:hypothetical protein